MTTAPPPVERLDLDLTRVYVTTALAELDQGIHPEEAFQHPNGYRKVVIRTFSDGSRLRLHHWQPWTGHEDPHDHRWDYSAILISGNISERAYAESPLAPSNNLRKYRYTRSREVTEMADCGPASLRVVRDNPIQARELRRRSLDEVHSLHVQSEAFSVMLTAPPRRAWSNVFAEAGRELGDLRVLTNDEVRHSLELSLRSAS